MADQDTSCIDALSKNFAQLLKGYHLQNISATDVRFSNNAKTLYNIMPPELGGYSEGAWSDPTLEALALYKTQSIKAGAVMEAVKATGGEASDKFLRAKLYHDAKVDKFLSTAQVYLGTHTIDNATAEITHYIKNVKNNIEEYGDSEDLGRLAHEYLPAASGCPIASGLKKPPSR